MKIFILCFPIIITLLYPAFSRLYHETYLKEQKLKKFKKEIEPLNLNNGSQKKLISMFKAGLLLSSQENEINWKYVKPLTSKEQFPYENLSESKIQTNQLVICKLNGGLGTTMGCTFPKSLIECQKGRTFFDLTIGQIQEFNTKYQVDIPLVLMQSFYTNELMKPSIEAAQSSVRILTFVQNKFPRIYEETFEPVPKSDKSPNEEWNPPGHGDVFHCLKESGLLEKLISEGKKFMFISNIDNLGARIDLKILNKIAVENRSYTAETVEKTIDDWKGGIPILYKNRIKLLELAQVPKNHIDDFRNINVFDIFNTNNMWINLQKLKETLDNDKLVLDVIKNRKVYKGKNIIQLEFAAGSAIQSFTDSISIKVPRSRFLPVKSCNELLLIRSDIYLRNHSEFILNEKRKSGVLPSIKLGSFFTKVSDFENRFKNTPSIINLKKLVVEGDITFGENIVLEGDVEFIVPEGEKWIIPDGRKYKNVIITSKNNL